MADNNRNQRGSYRSSNQDWNEGRGNYTRSEDDERGYGTSENRGYGNSSQGFQEGDMGWQSRYERENYDRPGDRYGSGRYGRRYENDMNWHNQESDRDYSYGSNYGVSSRGSRNLYDRDYEGINRSGYAGSGTRLGGSNYGEYGDRSRHFNEGRNYGGYSGSSYGGNYNAGSPGGRENEDRNWWDRASDEVSSWFGNEEAERRRDRDRMMSGYHKGKGPKNYNRSDDRIKEDVNDRLSDDPFIDATEIEVVVMNGEVTLSGIVDHRSSKRRAEDLAESVSGVKNVENRLRVGQGSDYRNPEREKETTGSQSTTTSAVPGSERNRKKDYVTG